MSFKNVASDLRNASDSELVRAVRQRLARQPGASVVLKRLAADLGVTPQHLSTAFQRSLGVSVAVYVRTERMLIAQRLLLQTSMSIQDIADELGFSCAANFSSAFRDFVGMSPSDFRRSFPAHDALTTTDVKWGVGPV